MSGPETAGGGQHPGHAGLLEKLMGAVRPEFRENILVFDPADPVFGGASCAVHACERTAHYRGLCHGHHQRWVTAGRPEQYPADDDRPWHGHGPLLSCRVPGCGFGIMGRQLCPRHLHSWKRAGSPDMDAWTASAGPAARAGEDTADCRIGYCRLRAHPGSVFCYSHRRRWKQQGSPAPEEFARSCENPAGEKEQADLGPLAPHLRLEMQYALQCRSDDNTIRTRPSVVRAAIRAAAGSGAASLLDLSEREWRENASVEARSPVTRLVLYARQKVDALDEGQGWESEYPRDTWRLRRLGIESSHATICFTGISQPWLRDLAKRWTRWRFSTGISTSTCYRGAHAVTRFSVFLGQARVLSAAQITREILERYLAALQSEVSAAKTRRSEIGLLSTFLQAVRRHEWDTTLPPSAMFFPEDYPKDGKKLPRALAEHVMAQVEAPGALDRQANPAFRLITLILIRCGLRASDAIKIPFDCVVRDPDGAPYLRYYNRKMKREALVPIDEELESLIGGEQDRILQRWTGGVPVLFPRTVANIDGHRPVSYSGYRDSLYRWLRECDVRDEHGHPVHLTPHQWRHTLGTRLINRDVPQHVVQKILDHDSAEMTAHYARLSDKTVREHWERARKVNAQGQPVQVSPEGPLGEAAWAKQRLSRATQALPNGYCELPMVKTCPHANSCLTCPMFVTTAEFLPHHHAQRKETLQIITAAKANGQARVAEMNRQVIGNIDKIIATLEADSGEGKEAAAGA